MIKRAVAALLMISLTAPAALAQQANFTGTLEVGGYPMTFPAAAALIAALNLSETYTGTPTFANGTYSALFTGGNVGIGTSAPGERLTVAGTDTDILIGPSADAASYNAFSLNGQTTQTGGLEGLFGGATGDDNLYVDADKSDGQIVLRTDGSGGSGQTRLTVNSSGAIVSGGVRTAVTTVASLPACSATNEGERRGVSDATLTTFLSTVAGGGANHVPVYCNGANWVIGG
jgi:hypothetical protein